MSPWPKGGGGESDVQIAHSFFAHRDIRKDNQNCIEEQQTLVVGSSSGGTGSKGCNHYYPLYAFARIAGFELPSSVARESAVL